MLHEKGSNQIHESNTLSISDSKIRFVYVQNIAEISES